MEEKRGLEAFEIWIRRRMMKVPWTEHKTNEEILKTVETKRKLIIPHLYLVPRMGVIPSEFCENV